MLQPSAPSRLPDLVLREDKCSIGSEWKTRAAQQEAAGRGHAIRHLGLKENYSVSLDVETRKIINEHSQFEPKKPFSKL